MLPNPDHTDYVYITKQNMVEASPVLWGTDWLLFIFFRAISFQNRLVLCDTNHSAQAPL